MKTHIVIVEFARKYGVKEGLVLTELCRRMKISGTAAIPFSVSLGKQHFPYLTEKQIRFCLANLREQGCIRRIYEKERGMDRTSLYQINDKAYQYYLQVMILEHGKLAEVMLPSSGDF
jgi:DNA-binding PadR family transcriptional regulator